MTADKSDIVITDPTSIITAITTAIIITAVTTAIFTALAMTAAMAQRMKRDSKTGQPANRPTGQPANLFSCNFGLLALDSSSFESNGEFRGERRRPTTDLQQECKRQKQ